MDFRAMSCMWTLLRGNTPCSSLCAATAAADRIRKGQHALAFSRNAYVSWDGKLESGILDSRNIIRWTQADAYSMATF